MTFEEYLSNMKPGYTVDGGSEDHLIMHELSQRALKITMELKGIVSGGGIDAANTAASHVDVMKKAYELGKVQILLERYAYSEISGTSILI